MATEIPKSNQKSAAARLVELLDETIAAVEEREHVITGRESMLINARTGAPSPTLRRLAEARRGIARLSRHGAGKVIRLRRAS